MNRIAFISDVHADLHALQDALVQIERLKCQRVVCGGDLVDYGVFPAETIALLRERRIPCIRGNHDRWAVGGGTAGDLHGGEQTTPYDASGWDLTRDALDFLTSLPTQWDAVIEGVRVAVHHASPQSDMNGIYPDRAQTADVRAWLERARADVLIVGHTHLAFELRTLEGGVIANPGALLRDSADPHPTAMLYDPDSGSFVPAPAPGGGTFGVLELPARTFTVCRAADGVQVEIHRLTVGAHDVRADR